MADHALNYEQEKKGVYKGLYLLAAVTLIEVFAALLGKGFIIEGFYIHHAIVAVVIIVLSLYKAYFIIYEFMHLGHEVKGMALTILLPLILLIWFIIAMLYEGTSWQNNRTFKTPVDNQSIPEGERIEGSILKLDDYKL